MDHPPKGANQQYQQKKAPRGFPRAPQRASKSALCQRSKPINFYLLTCTTYLRVCQVVALASASTKRSRYPINISEQRQHLSCPNIHPSKSRAWQRGQRCGRKVTAHSRCIARRSAETMTGDDSRFARSTSSKLLGIVCCS